jgi:uncharacterized membrane protein
MKKLLGGLYLVIGTSCLFGLPMAILGLSAWFGDGAMGLMHTSANALQHVGTQVEVMAIVFGTSAGGLAVAMLAFTGIWYAAQAINRMAQDHPAMSVAAAGRFAAAGDEPTVGRMQHAGTQRRARQQRAA